MISFKRVHRESLLRGAALVVLVAVIGYFVAQGYILFYRESPVDVSHGPRMQITPEMLTSSTEDKLGDRQKDAKAIVSKVLLPLSNVSGSHGIAAGADLIYRDQQDLDAYFAQLKDLGVSWVRWDMDWRAVQPDGPQDYRWDGADNVVSTAHRFGIKSLAIITYAPKWAERPGCAEGAKCPPADPAMFGHFAGQVASRYKDKGQDTFEIWNEPNFASFWHPAPNVSEYAQVLAAAHAEIKQANPAATVITGGLAAVGDEDSQIAPLTFVKELYASNAQGSFDAIAVHPYSFPALPSHDAWWNRWQHIVPIHDTMAQAGDGAKKVWITEVGAPTGGGGAEHTTTELAGFVYGQDYMSEAAQDELLHEALTLHKSYGEWAGPFFWYSMKDEGTGASTSENFFGLLRHDGSKKPAYHTYKNATADN